MIRSYKQIFGFFVSAQLICVFVFAYAKVRFSHDAAQVLCNAVSLNYPLTSTLIEPHREKTGFLPRRKQRQISFAVTAKLISAFVFATRIVQFLFYLNPKCQASSSFLSLYRPVCVGPGRKPRRPVFSRRGSIKLPLRIFWDFHLYFSIVISVFC